MKPVDELPRLKARAADSHKGDFGRVLVVGGSTGMAGAPCLCGDAALRSGAGLVTVAIPRSLYPIVATKLTNCMTRPLPERDGGIDLAGNPKAIDTLPAFDVMALGPGLGRTPAAAASVLALLNHIDKPLVVDADALNALAGSGWGRQSCLPCCVLTPHPGEMARLMGLGSGAEVQKDRLAVALAAAAKFNAVIVLKGHKTIVTDGDRVYINTTGNPGMATGGTGDVLTGVIAGLLAQGLSPFDAAQLGVYVHGLAGDLARDQFGEVSLVATDVLDALPRAFKSLVGV